MHKTISVKLPAAQRNSYSIHIGQNLTKQIITDLKKTNPSSILIITDNTVKKLFGTTLQKQLQKSLQTNNNTKIPVHLIPFKGGEKQKSLQTFTTLIQTCLKKSLDRKSLIIALGGGIVGDMAGFVASTYMRGIKYVQIPTTLLAQVDSSIGGKTGVDILDGKNICGTFHQPQKVYIDITYLKKLPTNHIKNGLVESIKAAIINNKALFTYIDTNLEKILAKDPKVLTQVIHHSCKIKVKIVQQDEKESKKRMLLNLGHTIGHAIEADSKYTLLHGQAIAHGIILESQLANKCNLLSKLELENITSLLNKLKFPKTKINTNNILKLIKNDKKAAKGKITFAVPKAIGNTILKSDIPQSTIRQVLKEASQ